MQKTPGFKPFKSWNFFYSLINKENICRVQAQQIIKQLILNKTANKAFSKQTGIKLVSQINTRDICDQKQSRKSKAAMTTKIYFAIELLRFVQAGALTL